MNLPILEFDPNPEALLNPAKLNERKVIDG
jgi:hypothetical protein